MGAALGLALGVGLVLVLSAWASPRERRPAAGPGRLARLIAAAGLTAVTPTGVLVAAVGSAVLAGAAIQAFTGTLPVAVAFAAMAGNLPVALLKSRVRRRRRDFAEVWPEAVDHLVSGVRAGLGLAEALASLAVRGPEPLRPAFARFALDHQTSGRLTDSLDRLKDDLSDPVGDRVVEALRVAREVGGGDLGRLLRNLSQFLREDARTRAELEARQAWTINGARLAVAAPWLVLVMLSFQGEVVRRYASPTGVVVLALGAAACVGAYGLMMRIGRLPTERRILG